MQDGGSLSSSVLFDAWPPGPGALRRVTTYRSGFLPRVWFGNWELGNGAIVRGQTRVRRSSARAMQHTHHLSTPLEASTLDLTRYEGRHSPILPLVLSTDSQSVFLFIKALSSYNLVFWMDGWI
jgi:hypothetical protein